MTKKNFNLCSTSSVITVPVCRHIMFYHGAQIPTINLSWWSSSGFLHQQEKFSMRTGRKSPINSVKERRQEAFAKNEIASTSYSNTNILQSQCLHAQSVSLATTHLLQITTFLHFPLAKYLKMADIGILNSHWPGTNPIPSSPFHRCNRSNLLNPSYVTDTLSSTASSLQHPPGPTNVILKNEAVCLPKGWNRQRYLLSPCARDARNTQGVSETGTDEARCVSHPCCWNGTELQHLATFLLWKTSEKSHHNVIGYHLPVCISFICTPITMLHCPFSNKMRHSI